MLRPARRTSLPLFFICPEVVLLFCCAIARRGLRATESGMATIIETIIKFCLIFILSLCTTEFASLCATTLSSAQQKESAKDHGRLDLQQLLYVAESSVVSSRAGRTAQKTGLKFHYHERVFRHLVITADGKTRRR